MNASKQYEYISDASFFVSDYCFFHEKKAEFLTLNPKENAGTGGVVEISPCDGLYLSCANWTPKISMERKYCIPKEFVKLYFLENGNVTLIQNGKKKSTIRHGVNLYLNRPASGRVLYDAMIPICYVSILIHRTYFNKIATAFPQNSLTLEDACSWLYEDYNTPEISGVFMQIRKKMIEGLTSAVYYESKTLEILSLIAQSHRLKQQHYYENTYLTISQDELYLLKNVGKIIHQAPMRPPSMEELCKMSTMSQTKLRELFKKAYGIPLGRYIQQCKLEHALVLLTGSLSIAEIAEELGYANTSKFSAAFKKQYQKTPSEYRAST